MSALYVSLQSKTLSSERLIVTIWDLGPKASEQLIKSVNGKMAINKMKLELYFFIMELNVINVC